jgi:hypothetical protein
MLPAITGMTGLNHHTHPFPLRWGFVFLLGLILLISLHSLVWQAHATVPSYWLRWDVDNFFFVLALNHGLSLPSS